MESSTNKIKQLDNAFLRKKLNQIKSNEIKFNFISARMKHSLDIVFLSLVCILISLTGYISSRHELNVSKNQVQSTQATLAEVKKQNEAFKTSVKQLKNTDYVEQVIREKYYYSKPNETIYSLPGDISKDVTQN